MFLIGCHCAPSEDLCAALPCRAYGHNDEWKQNVIAALCSSAPGAMRTLRERLQTHLSERYRLSAPEPRHSRWHGLNLDALLRFSRPDVAGITLSSIRCDQLGQSLFSYLLSEAVRTRCRDELILQLSHEWWSTGSVGLAMEVRAQLSTAKTF